MAAKKTKKGASKTGSTPRKGGKEKPTGKEATSTTATATAADLAEANALGPVTHPRIDNVSTAVVATLLDPTTRAALVEHEATLAKLGAPLKAATVIANAEEAVRLSGVHSRLQQSADRAHAPAEVAVKSARADAKALATALKGAKKGPLADAFATFVSSRNTALGVDARAESNQKKKRAAKKAAKTSAK